MLAIWKSLSPIEVSVVFLLAEVSEVFEVKVPSRDCEQLPGKDFFGVHDLLL